MHTKQLVTAILAAGLLAAACDSNTPSVTNDPTTPGSEASEPTQPTVAPTVTDTPAAADLALSSSDHGDILVDAQGNTLYLFVPDAQGDPTCYDTCAENWPFAPEMATVADGLDEALLGTVVRSDGSVQATYNGWPLYRFAADTAPGDTNGQGINDAWYVVDAEGNAVDDS